MSLPDQPEPGPLRTTYANSNGLIIGEMLIPKCGDPSRCPDQGPQIRGRWVEDGTAHACSSAVEGRYRWGNIELQFNVEYTIFSGQRDNCGQGNFWGWSGSLAS